MFSKACEYGIKAMIYIAQKSGEAGKVSLKEIAAGTDSPVAFTAKILQTLSREGLLISTKGPTGGFILAESPSNMNLAQIVSAIDGDSVFVGCGLGLETCDSERPCPVHHKFAIVRDELTLMLNCTTLQELALGLKNGASFLTR
ncbi:RrF2 family transcriptional regulator [Owenweeksia hongkongensis]|uniref:RrF2 family transcriptional regulator n=1 Tax=Owenweeksia hongkongensis TaxID=253245 RepID=UPI003A8E5207